MVDFLKTRSYWQGGFTEGQQNYYKYDHEKLATTTNDGKLSKSLIPSGLRTPSLEF
jgi:hypothetical protein